MRTFAPGFGGIPGRFWCGSGWVQTQKKPYFVGLFCLFALITCSGAAGKNLDTPATTAQNYIKFL